MEELIDEQAGLPSFLYAQLLRERTLLHRLARRHFVKPENSVDITMEPTEWRNHWHMVFRGTSVKGDAFRVTMCVRRHGISQWTMSGLRVFVNDVENDEFEGDLEAALAAALGGSAARVGDTQGAPAGDSRGARSNAVETRRATVIRN